MSTRWETAPAFLFFPSISTDSIGISAKCLKVCSIIAHEPLILWTKTSQNNLSFQEYQSFLCEKPETWQILVHAICIRKRQINCVPNATFIFLLFGWLCWLDRCKNKSESVANQRNYRKWKFFKRERSVIRIILSVHKASAGYVDILEKLSNAGCFLVWCDGAWNKIPVFCSNCSFESTIYQVTMYHYVSKSLYYSLIK